MKVTKEELAEMLQDSEYGNISEQLIQTAKDNDLVIVSGYSDDGMYFDGAMCDSADVYDGGVVRFTKDGVLLEWDDLEKDEIDEVRAYIHTLDTEDFGEITAIWNQDGYAWQYETDIPHSVFRLEEQGELYALGIVFDLEEIEGF